MPRRLGVVMDPISTITPYKDSTLAMMLEAQARGWRLAYMELGDLRIRDGRAEATMRPVAVRDDRAQWFELGAPYDAALTALDVVLMRKDPPVDSEFVAATHILSLAESQGARVVNRPNALRDANEKIVATRFPQCCPPCLVTQSMSALRAFIEEQQAVVVKPLDAMGGRSIFLVRAGDLNTNVILEEMTRRGQRFVIAQRFVEDIVTLGDKRILLIDGEPVPHAITRVPARGDVRGNIAAGGSVHAAELTERDRWICTQIAPTLREMGLRFVGIDVIGDYLTEINVTSPTCIREIDRLFGVNVAGMLMDAIGVRA